MNKHSHHSSDQVLLADEHDERFHFLAEILEDDFHLGVKRARSFNEVSLKTEEREWRLVILAEDLPPAKGMSKPKAERLNRYFAILEEHDRSAMRGLVYTGAKAPTIPGLQHQPVVIGIQNISAKSARDRVISELAAFGRFLPTRILLPDIELDTDPATVQVDPALSAQICNLSKRRDLQGGKKVIQHLTRAFFAWDSVKVGKLGQGLSGAHVFVIQPHPPEKTPKQYVLKLCAAESRWKLVEEVARHKEANDKLGEPDYRKCLPHILPRTDLPDSGHIAVNGDWYAVCYQYLGDPKIGGILDLESVLTCDLATLQAKTQNTKFFKRYLADHPSLWECRRRVFSDLLEWLGNEWYEHPELAKTKAVPRFWQTEDCPPRAYLTLPPYRLKGKEKGWILDFLGGREVHKVKRLLPSWEDHCRRVWEFVALSQGPTGLAVLDDPGSIICSPVHGDLNANNVLLWLQYPDQPFLIDFPCFQLEGHALQDLARLEVELLFALLDCQAESLEQLQVSDYAYHQLKLWLELAEHLLDAAVPSPRNSWQSTDCYSDNVTAKLDLFSLIRAKALAVQRPLIDTHEQGPFLAAYLPALLYYTLREIGYPSRTPFKRLLALYQASCIIERLRYLSGAA